LIKISLENQASENQIVNLSFNFKDTQGQTLNWLSYGGNLDNILVSANSERELTFYTRTDRLSQSGLYTLEAALSDGNNNILDSAKVQFTITNSDNARPAPNNIPALEFKFNDHFKTFDFPEFRDKLLQKLNPTFIKILFN
ncbi:MAG: hypothetical protein ABIJ94_04240, partial [candidate division WOR-3 bacterium]